MYTVLLVDDEPVVLAMEKKSSEKICQILKLSVKNSQ